MWLRGILHEEYGLHPDQARWVTFEDAHVATYRDPPWAERAPSGSDMLAMLCDGQLDAASFGNELPSRPDLAPVFPDPEAAGRAFLERHHFVPVNHMITVRAEVARRDGVVRSLLDRFRDAGNPLPSGRSALDPSIALALHYATQQGLLERKLTMDDAWAGLPPGCEE
jgi:4,5-dihydroxyphthalate decarboxylase